MTRLLPGSKVRFRVNDAEFGSGSSWSIETTKKTGDVYLFHREGGRWLKTSLHESGQWHYGLTAKAKERSPEEPAYLGITHEHPELAPGWICAKIITVAHSELRTDYVEAVKDRGVVDVPIDRSADATDIVVLLGDADPALIRVDNAVLVAQMRRGDGGQVIVYATPVNLAQPVHTALAAQIAQARAELEDEFGWDGDSATRIVINGRSEDGHLQEFEIAVDSHITELPAD